MTTWKRLAMPVLMIALATSLTSTASAGGWGWGSRGEDCSPGTRYARAEWGPAFCRAKQLESYDCAGLTAYAESTRYALNTRFLSVYQRPSLTAAPSSAPVGNYPLPGLDSPSPLTSPASRAQ